MQPEELVKPEVETKLKAITLPETAKPEDDAQIGILSRDIWSMILNHGSPNLWQTMRGVNRYFRFKYQFPWFIHGLNIKSADDFHRRMSALKQNPNYQAILGGRMTIEQAWVDQSKLTNALQAMGVTSLRDYHGRVDAILRTFPSSDFYQVSDIVPLLQDQAFLIDYPSLANRQNHYITHAALCILLKGYVSHKSDYYFLLQSEQPTRRHTFAYNAVLTLFDEHYLMPKSGNAESLKSLLEVDPDNLLLAFRSGFITSFDLGRDGFQSHSRNLTNASCLSFLCSDDGIEAFQQGWITREDLNESKKISPQSLMQIYLARRYPDLFAGVSPSSLSNKLLEKFFDPKRPKGQHENLIELFRSRTLLLGTYEALENSNIPLEDLLSVQDLLKQGYITTAQLNSLATIAAKHSTNKISFELLSRLLKLIGSPPSVAAFRDGVMTYDKLITTIGISGLQSTLNALPPLFEDHATNKTNSELSRLTGLKTQLSTYLKDYTKHKLIYHRDRATLLGKALDGLLPVMEIKKQIEFQLELYNSCRRPFMVWNLDRRSYSFLSYNLRHRTKGWVEWTFHKTLLKCQKAIEDYQAQPVAVAAI